jgi:threonine/homoserine/homoserine lactone efflux protein
LILREKILYYVLPAFFTAYLVYGFVRPSLSRAWRREIEEEDDEPEAPTEPCPMPPILHAALAGFVSRADVLLHSRRADQPHHPQRRRAARFHWAMLIGLGASVMELIYCAIAFTGFSSFFDIRTVKAAMEVFSFVFLLFLGKFLFGQTVNVPTKLDAASGKIEARLDEKLHPHSAFMTGFVRVMGNLGVLLTWIVLAANFMSHDWVADTLRRQNCVRRRRRAGHEHWFCALSYGVSRGHGRFSEQTLLRVQHHLRHLPDCRGPF